MCFESETSESPTACRLNFSGGAETELRTGSEMRQISKKEGKRMSRKVGKVRKVRKTELRTGSEKRQIGKNEGKREYSFHSDGFKTHRYGKSYRSLLAPPLKLRRKRSDFLDFPDSHQYFNIKNPVLCLVMPLTV